MHKIKWSDLQYVLAVANKGSLSAAATSMGVNHSTVLRRLNAFEHKHKLRVFLRQQTGYTLTPEGLKLLNCARSVEETVNDLERSIAGQDMKLEGLLRLTTTDSLYNSVLVQHLAEFMKAYPRIQLDVTITDKLLELSKHDADIAIRAGVGLPEDISGVRLCDLAFGIYGSPEYIKSLQGSRPLESAQWLKMKSIPATSKLGLLVADLVPESYVVLKVDSFEALQRSVERGIGLAILPCFLGDSSSGLRRINFDLSEASSSLWIMTHQDLASSAKVQAFLSFMEVSLRDEYPRLAGVFSQRNLPSEVE